MKMLMPYLALACFVGLAAYVLISQLTEMLIEALRWLNKEEKR